MHFDVDRISTAPGLVGALIGALVVLLAVRRLRQSSPSAKKEIRDPHEIALPRGKTGLKPALQRAARPKPRERPMPRRDPKELAQRAEAAANEIVRLANDAGAANCWDEIHESLLAMIAGVINADNEVHPGEMEFLGIISANLSTPESCRSFVNEYAAKWLQISKTVPRYFSALIAYDRTHGTKCARNAVRCLRDIVWYTSLADGRYQNQHFEAGSPHLDLLEGVIRQCLWIVQFDATTEMPKVPVENSIRRDDFIPRDAV